MSRIDCDIESPREAAPGCEIRCVASPSPRPLETDLDLVTAARAGSEEAWAAIVGRYYPGLLRYLTRQAGDPEVAADLAQDTFLTALIEIDKPGAERAFAAWLYRIAQNRLRTYRRRKRLRQFISLDWLRERAVPIEAWTLDAERTDELASTASERDVVTQVLDELSAALRDALLLHHLEGFAAWEVAAILGISVSAAERRITRAQAQFRARYNDLAASDETRDTEKA